MKASIEWVRFSESVWYPNRHQDKARRKEEWRTAITWPHDMSIQALTVEKFQGRHLMQAGIMHWTKSNATEYVLDFPTHHWSLLPNVISPDECLLTLTLHALNDQTSCQLFVEEEPSDKWDIDIFDMSLHWDMQGALLHAHIDISSTIEWRVWNHGQWTVQPLTVLEPGLHKLRITPPYGDIVYLHVEGAGHYKHIHRINVVGRAGVATGRHLWHKGMLYSARGSKLLPWHSYIVPVFHLSDIERFPRNSSANQIEWWLEEASWTMEAISLIQENFPHSNICKLGSIANTGSCDIITLRPYELHPGLDAQKIYALALFENSATPEFSQRIAWAIEKINAPEYLHLKFVERSWSASMGIHVNSEGTPLYGFGYCFTRALDHENLWGDAVRNILYREDKSSLPCETCHAKAMCKQLLPSSYQPSEHVTIPWKSLTHNNCVVQRWFS